MMTAQSYRPALSLAWLLEGLALDTPVVDTDVQGLSTDSRAVHPGDLFLAVQGLQVHGLQFAEQAVRQGAVAVLWEPVADADLHARAQSLGVPVLAVVGLGQKLGVIADRFFAFPSRDLHCIGVTGTDGKTSVTHFIAQSLSDEKQACGLLGTLGYGVYGALSAPTHTTPDALRLQAELAALRDRGVKQVALEVSSHALHQRRVAGVRFNTAVLTHLSRDHLDYHGSVEAYADAKRRLFETQDLHCAVLNVHDDFGRELAAALDNRYRVIAYQRAAADDRLRRHGEWLALRAVQALPKGISLQLDSSFGSAECTASLLGTFNAENLLAALGALLAAGLPLPEAVQRLARVKTVPGRMELFSIAGTPRAVVDYAHTPHALETALAALRPHCTGELICVFGAGGERDRGKRPQMGAVAERLADRVILTSDNPRSEDPQQILNEVAAGFEQPRRAQLLVDRAQAIEAALREAAPDDLVLVAGKGHEDYQQIGTEKRPFSDRIHVQQVLRRIAE